MYAKNKMRLFSDRPMFIAFIVFIAFLSLNPALASKNITHGGAESNPPSAYTELLDYVIPSPDQKRAGSCLYMSSTGAMEILINKYFGNSRPDVDGDSDLAELYALRGRMVVRGKSWFEDPILRFNSGGMLSRDVPFNPLTFWNDRLPAGSILSLPKVRTRPLYVAKGAIKSARLKLGILNESHVGMVKKALVDYRSPVLIIYRDAGFEEDYGHWDTWHAVVIVGFDDEGREDTGVENSCMNVHRSFSGLPKGDQTILRQALQKGGGCRSKGVFYVRDSEGAATGETRVPRYNKRSYDWLKYLGNHLFVAYLDEGGQESDHSYDDVDGESEYHRSEK